MDGPAYLCFYLTSRDNKRAGEGEKKRHRVENVVKRCGMPGVQILKRRGRVVSSSLHKPSAADMGVVRGVTEHSKWTSQTLKGASSGLPLMLPDLASGTERKCCRTQRGHRPSWPRSPCQRADCGGKERVKRDRGEKEEEEERGVLQEGNFKNRRRGRNKERGGEYSPCTRSPTRRSALWPHGPLNIYTALFIRSSAASLHSPFPSRTHPFFSPSCSPSPHPSLHFLSNDLHPSFMDSWL